MRALALLICAWFLAGCSSPPAAPGQPAPPVITLLSFNHEIWSSRMAAAHVLFQDGAQSVPCPGGTLWLFGDTFLGDPNLADTSTAPSKDSHPHFDGAAGATLGFLPAGHAALPPDLTYFTGPDGKAANPLALLPGESADQLRMWPLGGITIAGRIYIYYAMIQKTSGKAPWNFRDVGGGLSTSDQPLSPLRRLTPESNWRFPIEPIQVIAEGDMLYLYQVRGEDPLKGLSLARVFAADIERPSAYEFFIGIDASGRPLWSHAADHAAVLLKGVPGQVSIAWNQSLGAYLMATSSNFFEPRQIQFRAAPRPWGPWSAPARLAVPDQPDKTTDLIYCTFIHPELSARDGSEAVLTFCRMLHGDWELSNPESVRIRVSSGGSGATGGSAASAERQGP